LKITIFFKGFLNFLNFFYVSTGTVDVNYNSRPLFTHEQWNCREMKAKQGNGKEHGRRGSLPGAGGCDRDEEVRTVVQEALLQ
jgi:hypothetical protein